MTGGIKYGQSEIIQVMIIIIVIFIIMTVTVAVVGTLLTIDNGSFVPT
jgi:nitrate reductase NapE component